MKIHSPQLDTRDGYTFLAAYIEDSPPNTPDWLWFRVPTILRDSLTLQSDAFVSALLILAMFLGEDMEVKGQVSPRFAYGLADYQAAFRMWSPDTFKLVHLHIEHYADPVKQKKSNGIATAFSGGVDSFYSLWSNLPQRQFRPSMALTHALFTIGFDILLEDDPRWQPALADYTGLMDTLGLELLPIWTNARHFTDTVMGWPAWHWCFGSVLIGTAHAVGNKLNRFYLPAGRTFLTDAPVGSLPQIDHFLSSETLEIYHHGANVTRFEKIAAIADWPLVQQRLRICWQNPHGLKNCGECDKCLRTMIALDILGKLPEFESVFVTPLNHERIKNALRGHLEEFYIEDLLHHAVRAGRDDLVADLNYVLEQRQA